MARGCPSAQDSPGLWHVAQDRFSERDSSGSKNSMRPSATLALEYGLLFGNGISAGRRNLSCQACRLGAAPAKIVWPALPSTSATASKAAALRKVGTVIPGCVAPIVGHSSPLVEAALTALATLIFVCRQMTNAASRRGRRCLSEPDL